ncbi:hypothetical protein [Neorhizobium alkalisoli]|nr:hypothetical protein [Neorhizobium alkalisoli]
MKIAIPSDIHANRGAFEAVLADCRARGADRTRQRDERCNDAHHFF